MSLHDALLAKAFGGGAGGVDVTAAAVGQTIIVEEVDADGKPTKWKAADYQPRTHYDGIGKIVEEVTVGEDSNEFNFTALRPIIAGETYIVHWGDADYTCVAVDATTIGAPDGFTLIGNLASYGFEDTGEPFFIIGMVSTGGGAFTGEATPTKFSMDGSVAFPIPEKYLSNALPYYIDVEVDSLSEPTTLACTETVANVEAIFTSGRQLAVRCKQMEEGLIWGMRYFSLLQFVNGLFQGNEYGNVFVFTSNSMLSVSGNNTNLYFVPQEDGTYSVSTTYGS